MISSESKSRRLLPVAIIGALIAVALIGVGASAINRGPTANAQVVECVEYAFCISKVAPGGGGTDFLFQLELDEGVNGSVSPTYTDSRTLEDGDSYSFYFQRKAVIREVPTAGWRLVDVDCETNVDVTYISNGVILEIPTGDDISPYASCVFRNERIQQTLNLGGLFSGQPTPLPTAPAVVAPAATSPAITPPRTGDAGLK